MPPLQFSLDEITIATNNFDETKLLGVGGEGKVYKGHIQIDGVDTTVAVKLFKPTKSCERFDEEIDAVSHLHHRNVLSLIGYCKESGHKILVYEYAHNGSLADSLYPTCNLTWEKCHQISIDVASGLNYLHRGTSSQHKIIHRDVKPGNILLDENWGAMLSDFGLLKRGLSSRPQEFDPINADDLYPTCNLSWEKRLQICIEVAQGLEYLHNGTSSTHKIIHRDVKPANILLDDNWMVKLSDFGMLKRGLLSNPQESDPINTGLKGTFGYYDPEYVFKNEVTTKTDVYSFGVVMLEILCRKKREWPLHDDSSSTGGTKVEEVKEEEEEISEWVRKNIEPDLKSQISDECLEKFIDIARRCLLRDPKQRPSMANVVSMLEVAKTLQNQKSSKCEAYRTEHSHNSTSEKIAQESQFVQAILIDLQVNVEEKNASKYEAYPTGHSQTVF